MALCREAKLDRDRRARRQKAKRAKPEIAALRVHEMQRLFQRRWGRMLPDDDAGRDDFRLIAYHLASLSGVKLRRIINWAQLWAPWLSSEELAAIAEDVIERPRRFKADELGKLLRLSLQERMTLRIQTIGSFETTKAARAEMRKAKARERSRQWRRKKALAEGRLPRARPGRPPVIRTQ